MTTHRVPVGATPERKYLTWDEHRAAISQDALEARRDHRRRAYRYALVLVEETDAVPA